jgi:hypothetical protein
MGRAQNYLNDVEFLWKLLCSGGWIESSGGSAIYFRHRDGHGDMCDPEALSRMLVAHRDEISIRQINSFTTRIRRT